MSRRRCRTTKANVRPSPNRTERAGAVLKGRNGFLELRSSESPLQSETREGMDKVGLARKYHSETQGTPESRGEAAQAAHQTAERSLSYAFDVKRPAPPRGGLLSLTSSALSRSHRSCVCLSVVLLHCYPPSIHVKGAK